MKSDREAFQAAFDVSRETMERFDIFESLLRKWNKSINLVAASTVDDIWSRHFHDSASVFEVATPAAGRWLDLGTGGGFPGVVAAILAAERALSTEITCVEADLRKATFLRTLSSAVEIPFAVLSRRIEDTPRQNAPILTARALAPLNRLLQHCERHLAEGGRAIFLKGERWEEEVKEALETFRFSVEKKPSATNPGSAILIVGDVTRA